jgi:hypothetical protein
VPAASGLVGPAIDVSGIGPQKTLVVDGPSGTTGEIQVEGSTDGVNFCPITKFAADNPAEQNIVMVLQSMRCKRLSGSGSTELAVGGQAVTSNQFSTLDVALLDTSTMGTEKTIIITGDYPVAPIVVEGSNDDTNFDVVAQFDTFGSQIAVISGDYKSMRLRSASPVPVTMGSGFLFEAGGGGGDTTRLLEEVTNQSGGPMGEGDLVRLIGDYAIAPADGTTTADAGRTVGVLIDNLDDGQTGRIVIAGEVSVFLVAGLDPVAAGDPVWLSTSEIARGTNQQPGNNNIPIGVIKDASLYASEGRVTIDLTIEKLANYMAIGQRIVIGDGAQASLNSVALGNGADANNDGAVAIGQNAGNSDSGTPIVAIGVDATATGGFGVAIGHGTLAESAEGIAIGNGAQALTNSGGQDGSIAIGGGAVADGFTERCIAIGRGAQALSGGSIAIAGTVFGVDAQHAVAISGTVNDDSDNSIAINGTVTGDNSLALLGTAESSDALAIGRSALAAAFDTIAIGRTARANTTHDEAISIGRGAISSASHQCTIGGDGGVETGSGITHFRVQGGSPGAGINPIEATSVGLAPGETGLTIAARIAAAAIANKLVFDEEVASLPAGARVLYILP